MSMCAHLTPSSTKRWMNCAAVIEPPSRGPTFFMSAIGESISRSNGSASGLCPNLSPPHPPDRASLLQLPCELVGVGEQARPFVAETDEDRPGQGREVDDRRRLEVALDVG